MPRERDAPPAEGAPGEPDAIVERMRDFRLDDGRRLWAAYRVETSRSEDLGGDEGAPPGFAAKAVLAPAELLRRRRASLRALAIDEAYGNGYTGDDPEPTLERLGQVAVETMIDAGPLRGSGLDEAGAGASEGTRDAYLGHLLRPYLDPRRFEELTGPWRRAFLEGAPGHPFDVLAALAVLCLALAFAFWFVGGSVAAGLLFVAAALVIVVVRARSRRPSPSAGSGAAPSEPSEPSEP